jgi:hypothetical protein
LSQRNAQMIHPFQRISLTAGEGWPSWRSSYSNCGRKGIAGPAWLEFRQRSPSLP